MTDNPFIHRAIIIHKAVREKLLADDATLDEQTLADTTEGLTDLYDLLAEIVRGAIRDEAMTIALKGMIHDMGARLDAFKERAGKRRQIVGDAMLEADVKKIAMPDFTASLRASPPAVVVTDEKQIPADYWEHRPHLLKDKLRHHLKDGAHIAGAELSNPGLTLSIRK